MAYDPAWLILTGNTLFITGVCLIVSYIALRNYHYHKQAEQAIKDREEELAAIYDNAPLVILLVDDQCRVCKPNKYAEQFSGASVADLLHRAGEACAVCMRWMIHRAAASGHAARPAQYAVPSWIRFRLVTAITR